MNPGILYKYLVPERIDVLLKKKIRFTQPCFLNDPFEFRPGMPDLRPEELGHFQAKLAKQGDEYYREKSRQCGVLSLASKNNSIPMWTHYADSHRGFVIGFDTTSGLFRKAIDDENLRLVDYEKDRVSVTGGVQGNPGVNPDIILRTKSGDWAYEEEWRWIESMDPSGYDELKPGPNGELIFLRRIPAESIRQIIIGFRASFPLSETIQALTRMSELAHIEVFKVALSASHYSLEFERL